MDELAGQLDQPVYPRANYWVHLASEFQVPGEVIMKCQHSFERSPSKHLLEIKEGVNTLATSATVHVIFLYNQTIFVDTSSRIQVIYCYIL